jgi:CubicO group peptidase (beta-lactamase class C family)
LCALGLTLAAQTQTWPERLRAMTAGNVLAGAVTVVADKEKTLETEASGWADIEGQRPMKPDTVFWIASMTKGITGAALMILVDEGKVSLDDPVSKYVPTMKDLWVIEQAAGDRVTLVKAKAPVTVRQVMSNTGGFPFLSQQEQKLDAAPLRARIALYAQTPLLAEPGTRYQYSNVGINIAGYVIEVASGMPYDVFLRTRLFEPLGMTETDFWLTPEQEARLAQSYRANPEKTALERCEVGFLSYPFTDRAGRFAEPGGGLFSTAHDVTRFCRMLLNGGILDGKRILSEDAVRTLGTKQTGDVATDYGLGFETYNWGFRHSGAQGTHMRIDTQRGLVMVYLIQHTSFVWDKEARAACDLFVDLSNQRHGKK